MWNGKKISVVFPAYNEEPNIERAVRDFKILSVDGKAPLVDEVLVIDNNSKDRTGQIATAAGARVVLESKQGYGNALQRGLVEATGDLVVLCEPDGTFIAQDILKLLAYSVDFQMVCGTRTTRELIWEEANMGWFMRKGNWAVAKVLELLYNTSSLSDCGCTFRLISKEAATKLRGDLFVGRSHFLPNMIIAARKNNVSFIEIPLSYCGRVGESKITGTWQGTVKTALAMLNLILSSWPGFLMRKSKSRMRLKSSPSS